MKYGTELAEMVKNGKIKVENSQETALNEMEKKGIKYIAQKVAGNYPQRQTVELTSFFKKYTQ